MTIQTRPAVKILVVDDEPDLEPLMLQRFRRQIRDGEMRFVFARDGREALSKLEDDLEIELVLSDINMPVMDGLALLAALNEMPRLLKTVMVSAYNDMLNIRIAMNRGAYDFVTKPIDFDDLETTVRKTFRELDTLREARKTRVQLDEIHAELAVAAAIQQSLLPLPLGEDSSLDVAAMMLPARHVSGDFYDYFHIGDKHFGFVMGDVAGKGIPAALFMAVARTVLRAQAFQGATPDRCLSAVNRVLLPQGAAETYVTLFYGILDLESGKLVWTTGGHTPPWIVPADGLARQLKNNCSFMVGMFEEACFECAETTIHPGDTIIVYTDGITDAENPKGEMFGKVRLSALIRDIHEASAAGMTGRIVETIRDFTAGAPQADDITLLAVRFNGRQ
jgi:sigma-B regulation protein RsbU (phosphoserine phosphatase)